MIFLRESPKYDLSQLYCQTDFRHKAIPASVGEFQICFNTVTEEGVKKSHLVDK